MVNKCLKIGGLQIPEFYIIRIMGDLNRKKQYFSAACTLQEQ
jgi:hypothetical protein